jgi:hypothetical protein
MGHLSIVTTHHPLGRIEAATRQMNGIKFEASMGATAK